MGITYTNIEIRSPVRPDLSPVTTTALTDTGALHLWIPRHIALQLASAPRKSAE
jgi:hypothetical protein